MSKKAEGFSLRFVLINTGNISRKVLSKVLRSFDKNFERLHDEQFETEYKKLIDGLYERGIEDIDALKNEAYQKNCEDYQTSIQKVN